jgi:hypothetical protein
MGFLVLMPFNGIMCTMVKYARERLNNIGRNTESLDIGQNAESLDIRQNTESLDIGQNRARRAYRLLRDQEKGV